MTLTFTTYLLISGIGLAICAAADRFLLRHHLSLHNRRGFYILSLLLSLALPLVSTLYPHKLIPTAAQGGKGVSIEMWNMYLHPGLSVEAVDNTVRTLSFSWTDIIFALWAIGAGIMLIRLVIGLIRVLSILYSAERVRLNDGKRLYITDKIPNAFSFMGLIVLPREIYDDERRRSLIICHEEAHCTQRHHYDLILHQLCLVTHWWNPFAWILTGAHYNILEYLADNHVIDSGIDRKAYQRQLLESSLKIPAESLSLSFSVYNLKKRISMMNSNETPSKRLQFLRMASTLIFTSAGIFVGTNMMAIAPAPDTAPVEDMIAKPPPKKTGEGKDSDDKNASYIGGDKQMYKDLSSWIRYPEEAAKQGVSGKVHLKITVDEKGNVSSVEVKQGVHPLLDAEAVRVAKLMKYNPAIKNGKPVAANIYMPIHFRLDDGGKAAPMGKIETTSKPKSMSTLKAEVERFAKAFPNKENENIVITIKVEGGKPATVKVSAKDSRLRGELQQFVMNQTLEASINGVQTIKVYVPAKTKDELNTYVFDYLENMPEYIDEGEGGLMKALARMVKYPEEAINKNINGRVIVGFIVEKDGNLSNVKVIKSAHPLLDAEAVRVVEQLKFTPGRQEDGTPVRVRFSLPINFRIPVDDVKKQDNKQ
ncbi:M56 family metallopeptidase [Porphyromonas sp.]|uniref:M56 family metallopeptidase n=1 Tax=Porphyromonas sp. TaxID=1924944 RepID=UPI0026DC0118|nr:M56 family metallopeptidase [Porphyromonas sp.]MDO4770587.1 M56 family metallopeptidase [Porphyromonas sp.]